MTGNVLKDEGGGLSARPGSGAPKPLSGVDMTPAVVVMVSAPARWPEAVGAKTIWRKHVAEAARTPEQGAPPVGAAERLKSPVMTGGVMVIGLEVRLVRVKSVGALMLCSGTVPKSCVAGARIRPSEGRPVPVSVRLYGPPEGFEVRFKVAERRPVAEGLNCKPSQQFRHVPDELAEKAEVGGWSCP